MRVVLLLVLRRRRRAGVVLEALGHVVDNVVRWVVLVHSLQLQQRGGGRGRRRRTPFADDRLLSLEPLLGLLRFLRLVELVLDADTHARGILCSELLLLHGRQHRCVAAPRRVKRRHLRLEMRVLMLLLFLLLVLLLWLLILLQLLLMLLLLRVNRLLLLLLLLVVGGLLLLLQEVGPRAFFERFHRHLVRRNSQGFRLMQWVLVTG